jgi:ATP-dependent DNA ligase
MERSWPWKAAVRTSARCSPGGAISTTPTFDALWVNGKDLRALSLTRRKRVLGRLIWATTTVVSQVFSVEKRGRDLFAAAERLDLEGIVAKRKADPYAPETVWYKVKNRAYTQGEGRWELFQRRG